MQHELAKNSHGFDESLFEHPHAKILIAAERCVHLPMDFSDAVEEGHKAFSDQTPEEGISLPRFRKPMQRDFKKGSRFGLISTPIQNAD